MSSVITWMIVALLVVCMFIGMKVAAQKAAGVIAIFLPLILIVFLVRMFFTRENLNKLHEGVEKSGIGDTVERTIIGSSGKKSDDGQGKETPAEKSAPVETAVSAAKSAPVETAAPANVAQEAVPPVAATVKAEPQVKAEPVAIDYSKYDKGRKTYTYALPFNIKVAMSFRDGAYRFIAESLGKISASEKKEIGKVIIKSLSAYRGEAVPSVDKSKVSIDVKYDAESNRSKVFMVVPLDAVE